MSFDVTGNVCWHQRTIFVFCVAKMMLHNSLENIFAMCHLRTSQLLAKCNWLNKIASGRLLTAAFNTQIKPRLQGNVFTLCPASLMVTSSLNCWSDEQIASHISRVTDTELWKGIHKDSIKDMLTFDSLSSRPLALVIFLKYLSWWWLPSSDILTMWAFLTSSWLSWTAP